MSKIIQGATLALLVLALASPASAQYNRFNRALGAMPHAAEWPATVMCGEPFTVEVTMANPHAAPWSEAEFHKLGPVMGEDDPFRPDGLRFKMPDGTTVSYAERHTFTLELTAPAEVGSYETAWSMMEKGEPYGTQIKRSIEVVCDDAELGRALFPSDVACGSTFTAEVRMRNTGKSPWTEARFYKLGPVMGTDEPFRPDGHKFKMPDGTEVAVGDKYVFELDLTAPQEPGSYETQWSMMQGGKPFGEEVSRTIDVKCEPKR